MKRTNIILTLVTILMLIILIILLNFTYKDIEIHRIANSFFYGNLEFTQNNEEKIFSIDKITYFSSCHAKAKTNTNSAFIISDLYQYTDIAIFINNNIQDEPTLKNTLKSVVLSDINYSLAPTIGTPNLYYKNINDFATEKFSKDNLIKDSLTFKTTSKDKIDYSTPTLYNNCANPITLCYVNSNLKDNYTLSNDVSDISYNGSLLKTCGITLNSISCKLNLVITITNNLDESFSCPITLNIPINTENSTLYDGSLTIKDTTNYNFIKNPQIQ